MSAEPTRELAPGDVVWASLAPVRGREQGGHRPLVVIASRRYLEIVDSLALVVPVTTVDRGWPNHVALVGPTGLTEAGSAMTEQVRTVSRSRMTGVAGRVAPECLAEIRLWVSDFLDLQA